MWTNSIHPTGRSDQICVEIFPRVHLLDSAEAREDAELLIVMCILDLAGEN